MLLNIFVAMSEDIDSIIMKMLLLKDGIQGDGYLQLPCVMNVIV
jgi:hypothetical protein